MLHVSGGFFVFLRPHVGCVLPLHMQCIGPCIPNDIITLGHVNQPLSTRLIMIMSVKKDVYFTTERDKDT